MLEAPTLGLQISTSGTQRNSASQSHDQAAFPYFPNKNDATWLTGDLGLNLESHSGIVGLSEIPACF